VKLERIPDWRGAWRYASVQIAAVAAIFGMLTPETQTAILDLLGLPPERLPAVLGILFIVARLTQKREPP